MTRRDILRIASPKKRRVRHASGNFIGYHPSVKKRRMIAYESLLELDFVFLLDFDRHVLDFEEQPFSIPIESPKQHRSYHPDFLVTTSDKIWIVEIKPKRFLDAPGNAIKFEAAKGFCNTRGWDFRLFTESDIRSGYRLSNVKILTMFSRYPAKERLEKYILSTIPSDPPNITIMDMRDQFSEDSHNEVTTAIFRLAFFNRVYLPLNDAPLSLETEIALVKGDTPYPGISITGSIQDELL